MIDDYCYDDHPSEITQTDTEPSGWGFFSEEVGWFLYDFFTHRLDSDQKLLFYSYYITGMTLEEIADRYYGNQQLKKFRHPHECKEDDKVIENVDKFHSTFQNVDLEIRKINQLLRHSWKYGDKWTG